MNRKCYGCGEIIEPDRGLLFFTREENGDPKEGYLCETCADRRMAALKSDPFYSDSNMKALERSIQQGEDGNFVWKTLEELQALEDL